jgi:hypothetical protein
MTGNRQDAAGQVATGGDASPRPSPWTGESLKGRVASLVGAALLLPLCLFYAWNTLRNYADLWGHLAIGRWIVAHGHPPTHTLFLWTWHGPYIAHSWLSEVIVYGLIGHLADDGVGTAGLLSAGLLGFVAFAILWRLFDISTQTVYAGVALFSLAIAAEAARLLPRPEIATVVLLAVLLSILVVRSETAEEPTDNPRADIRLGALLVAMFILWTNLHGGMATGLIVLWIATVADLVQDRVDRRSMRLLVIAGLCTLSTLINPYGYHYYSIYTAVSTTTFSHITEWKPMYQRTLMPDSTLYSTGLIFTAALFAWIKASPFSAGGPGSQRRRWGHLIWLLVYFVMMMQARRNVGFFAIVCLAVSAPYFRAWSAGLKGRHALSPGTPVVVGKGSPQMAPEIAPGMQQDIACRSARAPRRYPTPGRSQRKRPVRTKNQDQDSGALRGIWPATALVVYLVVLANAYNDMGSQPAPAIMPTMASGMTAFVKQNGITDRVFNDYDSGMYEEWKLDGSPGLYIDGNNAYPDQVYNDYLDILDATPRGTQLFDQQGINCVMSSDIASWLCRRVASSQQWALAYYGQDGAVWIRRLPQYRTLWDGVPTWQGTTPRTYLQYLHMAAHEEE